jgi:hypothetical protein
VGCEDQNINDSSDDLRNLNEFEVDLNKVNFRGGFNYAVAFGGTFAYAGCR